MGDGARRDAGGVRRGARAQPCELGSQPVVLPMCAPRPSASMTVSGALSDAGGYGRPTRGPPGLAPGQAREARTRSEQSAVATGTSCRRKEQAMIGFPSTTGSRRPRTARTVGLGALLMVGLLLVPAPAPRRRRQAPRSPSTTRVANKPGRCPPESPQATFDVRGAEGGPVSRLVTILIFTAHREVGQSPRSRSRRATRSTSSWAGPGSSGSITPVTYCDPEECCVWPAGGGRLQRWEQWGLWLCNVGVF